MRPMIQSDGGDLELVDFSAAGVVSVRFHGACVGCPSAAATLKLGIERNLTATDFDSAEGTRRGGGG